MTEWRCGWLCHYKNIIPLILVCSPAVCNYIVSNKLMTLLTWQILTWYSQRERGERGAGDQGPPMNWTKWENVSLNSFLIEENNLWWWRWSLFTLSNIRKTLSISQHFLLHFDYFDQNVCSYSVYWRLDGAIINSLHVLRNQQTVKFDNKRK